MAALCGPGCGYCGGCTAAWERGTVRTSTRHCDTCGDACGPASVLLTLGVFCSARCADVASNLQIQTDAAFRKLLPGVL
jgi:hypothetical protein